MCNLSEGIEERAAEKTLRETNKIVITNMHRKGYTLEQIAEIVEIKPEEVGKIIEEESMSVQNRKRKQKNGSTVSFCK